MSEYQQFSERSTGKLLFQLLGVLLPIPLLTRYLWEARAVSWFVLGGGIFITTNVFIEAASNTQPGQYISGWWWRIGDAGQLLIILLLLCPVLIWMTVWLGNRGSLFLLASFLLGMLLGLVVKVSMILVKRGFRN